MNSRLNSAENKKMLALLSLSFISVIFLLLLLLWITGQLLVPLLATEVFLMLSRIGSIILLILLIISVLITIFNFTGVFKRITGPVNAFYNRRKRIFRIANFISGTTISAFILTVLILTLISPIKSSDKPEDFTVLYDEMYGPISEYSLKLLFTPLALSLQQNNEKLAILPCSGKNLENALHESKYIYIASHGLNGEIVMSTGINYSYIDFASFGRDRLKYLYFSACELGVDDFGEKWKDAMFPAEIRIFDRNSAIAEHVIWALFAAAGTIRETDQ